MNTLEQIMTIEQPTMFLTYKTDAGNKPNTLSLHGVGMHRHSDLTFDVLVDHLVESTSNRIVVDQVVLDQKNTNDVYRLISNKLATEIAARTRRGAGNILVVQSLSMLNNFNYMNSTFEHCVVDPTLQSNEVRVILWCNRGKSQTTAVDGGLAVTPDGIFLNVGGDCWGRPVVPSDYFAVGFIGNDNG